MIDPVTALAVISGTVKAIDTIAKTTKNIGAIHSNLKKLSEAGFKDGGLVNLTAIKIPDNNQSGVESLFKRR